MVNPHHSFFEIESSLFSFPRVPNLGLSGGCGGPSGAESPGWGAADLAPRQSDCYCQYRLFHASSWRVYPSTLPSLHKHASPNTRWDGVLLPSLRRGLVFALSSDRYSNFFFLLWSYHNIYYEKLLLWIFFLFFFDFTLMFWPKHHCPSYCQTYFSLLHCRQRPTPILQKRMW